jgi:hypothetical protein
MWLALARNMNRFESRVNYETRRLSHKTAISSFGLADDDHSNGQRA